MSYRDIITIEPEKRGGKPCIRGMRITVNDVLGWLSHGMTEEEILDEHPGLEKEDFAAVYAFAAEMADMAYGQLVVPLIVAGIGVSLAIPSGQNSVVGSVTEAAIGKAAGTNSMMRELGGVFGIAVAVAAFAAAGSYSSPAAFIDGFGPAIGVASGLAAIGAIVALMLPGRRSTTPQTLATAVPAVEVEAGS